MGTSANVATAKGKFRVRLRGKDQPPLPCTVGSSDGSVVRATLYPGKVAEVPLAIYQNLYTKFGRDVESRYVPDPLEGERNPSRDRDGNYMMREESKPGYVIEFLDGPPNK